MTRQLSIAFLVLIVCLTISGTQGKAFVETGNSICKTSGNSACEDATVEVEVEKYLTEFLEEFKHHQATGVSSTNFVRLLDLIKSSQTKITLNEMPNAKNKKLCLQCLSASYTFLEIYKEMENKERPVLVKLAKDICNLFNMKPFVCEGHVEMNADLILYMLEQLDTLPTVQRICEITYQGENCVATGSDVFNDRYPAVDISPSDKALQSSKPTAVTHYTEQPLTIVHLTDIHYDPEYTVGVNADCGAGTCCRALPDLEPADSSNAAGYWGDYHACDTPWHAVVDVLDQIRAQHIHIDAVYFTGDIIHHFTWNTTLETNIDAMQKIYRLLKERFAGIPVYPVLGNHEAHPSNIYAPHEVPDALSSKYLYDLITEEWNDWLPDDVNDTLAEGGYYTVLSPLGHRIIALNNNFCFNYNRWLFITDSYFTKQLQWLNDVLLAAEDANEKVHILGHLPSYDNYCYLGWTREYRRIVERFAHIIEGQFNGHSHVDEFNVYYKKSDPSAAVNVAWNGGSTTAFSELNPNYKVFYADRTTFEILDQESWMYNLTEANQHPDRKPAWFKAYTFKEHYGLADLSPQSLDGLLQKFARSEADLLQYWKLKQKYADPLMAAGCDADCLRETFCDIARSEYGDDAACERLLAEATTGSRN